MTQLLNEDQTSEYLNVSKSLLRKWRMERTHLPFVKLGSRIGYKPQDLELFVSSQTIEPIKSKGAA